MKESQQRLAIFATSLLCVFGLCFLLIVTGVATPFISGFAVDSNDRIYIGNQNQICVYEGDALIQKISPQTSRSYAFTIVDDHILLSTSITVYTMDLDGNIIDTQEDPGAHTYNQIQYSKRQFISNNNDTYKLKGQIGWTRIVKNGTETVYQISFLSFLVKILFFGGVSAVIIVPVWMLLKNIGNKKDRERPPTK